MLFSRNGFRGTGTSEIAAAAGCSEPVIYKHFASKQALFVAVLEDSKHYMRDRLAAAAEGEGDLFDAYRASCAASRATRRWRSSRGCATWR